MASSANVDWAGLPELILDLIVNKLVSLFDYLHFSVVCKRWCSIARDNKKQRRIINASRPQLPLLLIPTQDQEQLRSLYSITKNMIYDFQVKVPYTHRASGSSHGWLVTTNESMTITLLNPFSDGVVRLPPITREIPGTDDYKHNIKKAILSADPCLCPDDFEVAIIYDGMNYLALFKSSDKSWSYMSDRYLEDDVLEDDATMFFDIIYHKGKLHALDYWMRLVRITSSMPLQKIVVVERPSPFLDHPLYGGDRSMYVVETSSKDLLLIRREYGRKDIDDVQVVTMAFEVFKLVHSSEEELPKWVETESLGDDALFLGINYSMSLSTLDFPGCQPNCIYYTDDGCDNGFYEPFGPRDMGIFNLKDKSFSLHYVPDSLHKDMPPPVWIVPTL